MFWREESAAYEAGCIGQWHLIPDWRKAIIVAVHENKVEMSHLQTEAK